ncbi:MAG TPA: hypothetical protein PLE22_03370 [Acidovorax sp.]|jgi:hypothetical protein|nr:hypothetical protein [Acidovorax sp.]
MHFVISSAFTVLAHRLETDCVIEGVCLGLVPHTSATEFAGVKECAA